MDYPTTIYLNFVDEDNIFFMNKVSEWKFLNPTINDTTYNFSVWLFANIMATELNSFGRIMSMFNRTIKKIEDFKKFNMIALALYQHQLHYRL